MGTFDDLYASLHPDDRLRGFEFEHICKWYLQNDPTYASRLKRVWLWKEWPGRWRNSEAGIDLVAEDTDGKLWAAQSKAYGENKPIPKRELDKFLTDSSRTMFSYRLLISTTTNGLHHIAAETVSGQEKPVLIVDLLDLRKSPVDWPESLSNLRPAQPREPAMPREHQDEAILSVLGGFEATDRGQLIMACGTGKTLTAWFINEKLAAERTLVLVPSLSLLKQTMREWERASGGQVRFASMPVCSDASVSNNEDAGIVYTAELGVPAETDPEKIAAFLRKRGPRVVFSTYHSSPQIAKAFEFARVPAFDLVVADEAHRVAGPVSSSFATILDTRQIKAKRRLFMTATPRVYSGATKKASKDENFEYASMDDQTKFGPVFHKLSFSEAIERKLLTKYRVAIIGVDDAMYHEWTQRGTFVTFDGKTPVTADKAAGQIGLAKAMREFGLRRTISFHSRVARAKKFAASMESVIKWMPASERPSGKLWAEYASGEMDAGKRARLIQRLAELEDADRGLLTNARCLAEGVDVPTLDGVAFIDPRRSEVDIVQAVGRAIRKADDKHLGTVVIPVFIAGGEDPETVLDTSAFKPVWDVLRALRSHDDELGRQLDALRREMGSEGRTPQLPSNIYTDIPKAIGEDFAAAFRIRLVEQTTRNWEFWYGLLERHAAEHGTANVGRNDLIYGHRLSPWIGVQRSEYKNGKLSDERRQRLEELPGWTWNTLNSRWERTFRVLQEYVDEYKTARVPQDFCVDGLRLGTWVTQQRSKRNQGKLSDERARRLEALPKWTWDSVAELWEDGFRHLEEYVAQHGDALVPGDFRSEDDFQLGVWISTQRSRFTKGKLESERQNRLESLSGWTWNQLEATWAEGFENLLAYIESEGDSLVPFEYRTARGHQLGAWVSKQRVDFSRGALREDRRERLEPLPGWTWNVKGELWEDGFAHLLKYIEQNGHSLVPVRYRSGDKYSLGVWVASQRRMYAQGIAAAERRERLDAIPEWVWAANNARWEDGFRRLQLYVEATGSAVVTGTYLDPKDGYTLGRWVNKQRQKFSRGGLTAEQVSRLEKLHGWRWAVHDGKWEEGFRHLEKYLSSHGDAQVSTSYEDPDDGYKLGVWVGSQRGRWSKGTLQPERAKRLEALPGWQWETVDNRWEEGFQRLEEYVKEAGTARVGARHKQGSYPLGQWVNVQRTAYRDGTISAERRKRLEQLPEWSWNPAAERWESMFALLEEYAAEHGGSHVPVARSFKGEKLGTWVSSQRLAYSKCQLGIEQQRRFEALPGWTWTPGSGRWEKSFQLLQAYAEEHGSLSALGNQWVGGVNLGSWATNQRVSRGRGALSPERQELLEGLPGWTWDAVGNRWETMFGLLQKYAAEHGSSQVPSSYSVDDHRLGSWVSNQRAFRRNGKLSPERQRLLESLPGWDWELVSTSWERAYGLMDAYVREHGNFVVPKSYSDAVGFNLGAWVNSQRTKFANGTLQEDRQRRLEGLPGWVWAVHEAKWDEGFRRLQEYVDKHGDAAVKTSCVVDRYRLGGWVAQQRSNYTKGVIKPDQQRRLEELSGWTWNALEARWEEGFLLVTEYIAAHKSANVPRDYSADGFRVGQWVREQRRVFADGKMTEDRRKRLEKLPGWVWDRRGPGGQELT
jgi:superfamily II DNA or RNA helicase